MTPLELAAAIGLAVLALVVLLRRRSSYQSHLQQLGAVQRRPKRQLVVGTWTRAEVAEHAKEDDLWLIIQVGRGWGVGGGVGWGAARHGAQSCVQGSAAR